MTTPLRLLLPVLLLLSGCPSSTTKRLDLPELPAVEHVDVERYLGTWHEIASFPQSFQKGCTATTATYELRADGQLDVINRCNKGGLDGKEDVATGRARIVDATTNAKLEVSFFRPFWGDYWIIDLADDYSYAVIGHPSRDYLWILSRTPQMQPSTYDGIIERLKGHGYEVDRLNKTPQPASDTPAASASPPPTDEPAPSEASADSMGGAIAQRVVALNLSTITDPKRILEALDLPTPVELPREHRSHVFQTDVETPEGMLKLSLFLKAGTWEPPRGNSAPSSDPPVVEGIELTGPNGLQFDLPPQAEPIDFHGESDRRIQAWSDTTYFEQGSASHGWTVSKFTGRAPFHTTAAERAALEDALIWFTDQMKAGTPDLQVAAATHFADRLTDEDTYDFGVGILHVMAPHAVAASWYGPTQLPRFFRHLDVPMIQTSFAHDAGQTVLAIQVEPLVVNPTQYYFTDPDSSEDEMGLAAEAKFRGLAIYVPPAR